MLLSIDDLVDDILAAQRRAERRARLVRGRCAHCKRALRVEPDSEYDLCKRCAALPNHSLEDRLIAAIFDRAPDCSACLGKP